MGFQADKLLPRIPALCKETLVIEWSDQYENLTKFAQAWGWKKGSDIWNADGNKKLVKLRKTPDSLKSGDKLTIPIPPQQVKKLHIEADKYNKKKRAYVAWINVQEDKISELEKKIGMLYKDVDKLGRNKFDGSDRKKSIDKILKVLDPVASVLHVIALTKVPMTSMRPVIKLQSYLGDLKKERVFMKGGNLEMVQLEKLKILMKNIRKEIAALEKEIVALKKELDEEGFKTIKAWCKIRSVSVWGKGELENFSK